MEKLNRTSPALTSLPERTTAHSVEIIREEGEDGRLENFGFTVWRDNPPLVGSIIPGGPADRVGLKSNLVILSVNGQPVDHLPQHSVADLIHNTPSRSVWLVVSESAEESAHFRTTLGHLHSHSPKMSAQRYTLRSRSQHRSYANATGPRRTVSTSRGVCSSTRVFVHYLGPVEMPPKWYSRGLSLKCIRECVRRMLSVREQHIEVYLVVSGKGMSLQNTMGRTLVTYTREELFYCGVHMDDECYFGIVTRHQQQPVVDPQVGQVEDTAAAQWVHHCHVFKVVQGQSKITMTFGQVSSPMNKEQTTPVRSSRTVVNYIRQLFRTEAPQPSGADSGDVRLSPKPPAVAVQELQGQNLPTISRVESGSPVSTSDESSPVLERRRHDLVDLRHLAEETVRLSQPMTRGTPSATTLTSHGSASELVRSAEHVPSVGNEPALQQDVPAFEHQDESIHSPPGRVGLPPKNSHLSSSIDSVMTTTTTQADNYDSAPQVGGWITSFDKLLQDPLGLHCFQKFLSSEFSEENIGFWKEVERYKSLQRPEQHKPAAQRIYHLYVNPNAQQPVNLDGTCVVDIQERMGTAHPPPDLFNAAQKQIYNLMRLDSYQRFKRSEVVQKCLMAEMDGRPLPVSLPQEEHSEERDKLNPLSAVRMEEKADGDSKQAKETTSKGRGLFTISKRSNSFRNNSKASRSGMYFTNEGKKKSKTVRDKTRGAASRVEPEPEGPAARSGFQMQEEDDTDHLEVLNERVGPCFGLALMEKVSKIIPVPKQGSVYDALKNVVRLHKLTFEAIDIRFADNMQPVDLEAAASVLAGRYLVVKQSQEYFQAIFPGREVSVAADPNKRVQQVMDPVLQEMGLDPSAVTLYVYGARQALSWSTYAGLLKGQKVHVRMNKTGLSPSHTQGSLSSADSRSSLHSSSGNLSQHARSPRPTSQIAGNSSHNNSNKNDDLFSMIFKLQSDTLSEQRSCPPPISALPTSQSSNPVAGTVAAAADPERHSSEPPAQSKLASATSDQSLVQHMHPDPPPMFTRVRSGSQPSLNESFQEAVTGRKCVSPPPTISLSQDSNEQGPLFNVEIISQRYRPPRRSHIPPPTQPPPILPHGTRGRRMRSTSPPPLTRPPPLPGKSSAAAGLFVDRQSRTGQFRSNSPLTVSTDASSRGRALSTGAYSRELTPTSGYGSHSPDSSTAGFSQSHLDNFVFAADSHLPNRARRGSKESSSSSDGTYMSFQQPSAAKHPAHRVHRTLQQTHSEPVYPLSQPSQPHRAPPPPHPLWQWPAEPLVDESDLLRKGQEMLEQEFSEFTARAGQPQGLMYRRFAKVGHKKGVYRFSPPPVDGSMV